MKLVLACVGGVAVWSSYILVGSKAFAFAGQEVKKAIKGNGISKTETRSVGEFRTLILQGALEGELTEGQNASMKVTADSNIMPHIKQELKDGTLRIYTEGNLTYEKPIKLVLSARQVDAYKVSGACKINAKKVSSHPLNINASGASVVSISGTPNALDAEISGAGSITLGKVNLNFLGLNVTGASHFKADGKAASARITASGASSVSGNLRIEKGSLNVSGASSIDVTSIGTSKTTVSGVGSINRL